MKIPGKKDSAVSPAIGTIIMIALTIILIYLLLSALLGMIPDFTILQEEAPEYFIVTWSDSDNAILKLLNTGPSIINQDYSAKFYVNEVLMDNIIVSTLSGYSFIPTQHFGVARLYGAGPRGLEWETNTSGFIDLSNGTFSSGDRVRVDIILNKDNSIYSSTTYICP